MNTPAAEVVALGKHMMFWERQEEFNRILDRFLMTVKLAEGRAKHEEIRRA